MPWEVAGLAVRRRATAYAAVRAVGAGPGDTVVVSGAAGGVGSLAVQLARRAGATVIGLAGEANHEWLAEPRRDPGRLRRRRGRPDPAARRGQVDAFIDMFGAGYVELALDSVSSRRPDRHDRRLRRRRSEYGVKAEGNAAAASAGVLAELAGLIAHGELEIPIAATFPLAEVREAYRRPGDRPHPRQDRAGALSVSREP